MFLGRLFVMSMAAAKVVAIQRKISKDFMVITQGRAGDECLLIVEIS